MAAVHFRTHRILMLKIKIETFRLPAVAHFEHPLEEIVSRIIWRYLCTFFFLSHSFSLHCKVFHFRPPFIHSNRGKKSLLELPLFFLFRTASWSLIIFVRVFFLFFLFFSQIKSRHVLFKLFRFPFVYFIKTRKREKSAGFESFSKNFPSRVELTINFRPRPPRCAENFPVFFLASNL